MKKIKGGFEVTMDAGIGIKIDPINNEIIINNKYNNPFNLTDYIRVLIREEVARINREKEFETQRTILFGLKPSKEPRKLKKKAVKK